MNGKAPLAGANTAATVFEGRWVRPVLADGAATAGGGAAVDFDLSAFRLTHRFALLNSVDPFRSYAGQPSPDWRRVRTEKKPSIPRHQSSTRLLSLSYAGDLWRRPFQCLNELCQRAFFSCMTTRPSLNLPQRH